MVARKWPKIAKKPLLSPKADDWVSQGGLDPEIMAEAAESYPDSISTLDLDEISDRFGDDTRPLNQVHVEDLAASIAALGLIQPIAVDNRGRLLAGGHRKAAILHLRETAPEEFEKHFANGIPVFRYEFDAELEPDRAFAIEATENEKRRDYTPAEVRELAARLKTAGYHHTRGRAKSGNKALMPSLAVIVGKSERQIKRYLADKPTDKTNGTDGLFSQKYLTQAIKALRKYQNSEVATAKERKLLKEIPSIIEQLEQALED